MAQAFCSGCCPRADGTRLRTRPFAPAPTSLARRPVAQREDVTCRIWPFDLAWAPAVSSETLGQVWAPQLFAASLFPYLGFLYHLTTGRKRSAAPGVMIAGFYFLLVFVGATIPAGIYCKTVYGTSLANVDWIHGSAESLLTVTNLLLVVGLRQGISKMEQKQNEEQAEAEAAMQEVDAK